MPPSRREGAPDGCELDIHAALFDLDGVVTRTADLHAAAWQELFDELLRIRIARGHGGFPPFDPEADYLAYVDGKPRHEGVRAFLAARGLQLEEGDPEDRLDAMTVEGLASHKDGVFIDRLRREGVGVFASTISLIERLRERGVKTAVVTSSRNGREVLRAAGIEELFDARVDGIDAMTLGLAGKPDPAPFLHAAKLVGVPPGRALVIEDAVSGVEAGRRGGFGLVIGVDRGGNREALANQGADVVVADLAELDIATLNARFCEKRASIIAWRVEQEGFDPAREHAIESIFTVGNGYLGVRGAVEAPLAQSQGDLFVAGVYDRKHPSRPYSELEFLGDPRAELDHSELVTAPFPFRIQLVVDGVALDLAGPHWRVHRRSLDLRRGVLHGHTEYETDLDRRVVVQTRRWASLADLHLVLQEVTICLPNHAGEFELDTSLRDPNLTDHHPHLVPLDAAAADENIEVLRFSTQASRIELCLAAQTLRAGAGRGGVHWQLDAALGQAVTFRRYVAIYTSADVRDPVAAAIARLTGLRWEDLDDMFAAHVARWDALWARADVRIPDNPATEQALRFNAYHLISAADRDPRVSVPARALTGRAYEGHVFWDVEMFKLPFYLHTVPDVAKHLLLYRYTTLDGARRKARELGHAGACYAWESTVNGDEVTPRSIRLKTTGKEIPIFTGIQQLHVTAGVAHGLCRYWDATGDDQLMRDAGVEILVETARFWASRCTRGPRRYHLRDVVGPDEYHHSVHDNAYTNWMAHANLTRAAEAAGWLRRTDARAWAALAERLAIAPDEPGAWAGVASALHLPGPDARGVIEQFEGFYDLEDYPLPSGERFRAPIDRLFDWDRINGLKLVKQADVLMLLHVLPDAFPREVVAANYHYYEPMTDHGSSLSPGIHCAIAARLGLVDDAVRYWRESLWLDLSNRMENSALGVHPACMGATWQALVFGFLGVRFTAQGPILDPEAASRLPEKWREVAMTLTWRGVAYPIRVAREGP